MKKNRVTIFCNDASILDAIVEYLYSKKIIKSILQINDKFEYPYVIIVTSIKKEEINKMLKSKIYKNNYKLR